MITHDGFSKRRCYLEGDCILVDELSYPIETIVKAEKYKSITTLVVVMMLILTVFLAYAGYMGFQQEILKNADSKDRIVQAALMLIIFSIFAGLWWGVLRYSCFNSRSFWIVNGKGIYVEQNDDIEIEQRFRDIEIKLNNAYTSRPESHVTSKIDKKSLLTVIVVVIFLIAGFVTRSTSLIILSVSLIFILRLYSLKKDFDELKWKK